jgi:DNA-directed RNA polymerase subunit K/omega
MKFKNTGAQKSTITRDVNDFVDKTDNIFKAVSVMAKRSTQVNEKMKAELMLKFYESLPKPWAIAMKELLNDEIYMRDADEEESVGNSNNNA